MHLNSSKWRVKRIARRPVVALLLVAVAASVAADFGRTAGAADPDPSLVRLALDPDLSPDGGTLAFSWRGDIWTVSSNGGTARRLTLHDAQDRYPKFSPDGNEIAFTSDRDGSPQVYAVAKKGGPPRQVTHHTAGYQLEGWYPDGQGLLVSAQRDHFWKKPERFFRVSVAERTADQLLFDDYGGDGALSPDGKRLLFTREGPAWWRKGYRGSQAAQIWLYDLQEKNFSAVINQPTGARFPLWKPNGDGFYFVSSTSGSQNLWEHDLKKNESRQLTKFDDDSVVFPCLSRDGSTIVFRHLFDFYRFQPATGKPPKKLAIKVADDAWPDPIERRMLSTATHVTFSRDGLEIAFIAGGDVWVMDTELREPKQVTATPEEERDVTFSPDGQTLTFVSDSGGQTDLWSARRAASDKFWWLNDGFPLTQLTNDTEVESDPKWSPDGSRLAFVRGLGELWHVGPDGKDGKRITTSYNSPDFDWSPDGRWMAYAQSDNDFNRDIWIVPLDGSSPPINVSRHPDNDGNPVWSPDGRALAFTGRRADDEVDVLYVWLRAADEETSRRDRALQKAVEKMQKGRTKSSRGSSAAGSGGAASGGEPGAGGGDGAKSDAPGKPDGAKPDAKPSLFGGESTRRTPPKVVVELEGLHDRIHRISLPDSTESGLFWSPDGKKLAFSASVEGKRGTYYVDFPEDLKPKSLVAQTGALARWLDNGSIVWLSSGVPGAVSSTGTAGGYRFQARQAVDRRAKNVAVFDQCWRVMRDRYYDERLGNRNWDAVRRKYQEMAGAAPDLETLTRVIQLMLGELNGSHLGFSARGDDPPPGVEPPANPPPGTPPASPDPGAGGGRGAGRWSISTAHLGVRFVADHPGPGLKVRDVLPEGPAARSASKIEAGEIVLSIDGKTVDPALDLTLVLNGVLDRDVRLRVKSADGKERDVAVRPISYSEARRLLYDSWVKESRKQVDKLSQGKLGYLHISGMSMPNFYRFEEELYAVGAGKDGLVIDVRENPGGSITDHLLTVLTQPIHAITVPRGGGPGYPQDRIVYATWRKPIVVLCNQNSFSNAEIFSHAIRALGRGKVVGVPTAGGVISTGAATIMDVGTLRLPFRGWYDRDTGEDMELRGAEPHVLVWPAPGELPRGVDKQLEKAIEVLTADVAEAQKRPAPALKKASERK